MKHLKKIEGKEIYVARKVKQSDHFVSKVEFVLESQYSILPTQTKSLSFASNIALELNKN